MAKTKKVEEPKVEETTIVENETVVNENEVNVNEAPEVVTSTGDVKTDEPSVPAPTTVEALKVQIAFTDKYTGEEYPVGHVLENLSEERYEELINDPRKLVCKNY